MKNKKFRFQAVPSGCMEVSTRASCGAAPSKFSCNICWVFLFFSSNFQPLPDDFVQPLSDVGVYKTALRVDSTGTHVNGEGNYGFCSSTCTAVSLFDLIGNLLGEIFFINCNCSDLFLWTWLYPSLYSYSIKMQKLIAKISLQATPAARQQSEDPAPSSSAPPRPLPAEWWPGGRSKRCQMYHAHSE